MSERLLDLTDCVFGAEQSVRRARETVEDLRELTRSALRVLDEAETEAAHADTTESDPDGRHLEAVADHLSRLTSRCTTIGEISHELNEHLEQATAALARAGRLIDELDDDIDPQATQTVAQLAPRLAMVSDMVEVARPMSQTLSHNIASASTASQVLTPATLMGPRTVDPRQVAASIRSAGQYLHRADEDARLAETVLDRAGATSRQTGRVAGELADHARQSPREQLRRSPAASSPRGPSGPGR
ncbi:hypothetical protein BSP109_02214 [Brevibacterium sp. Mu109]|nr:hypothetical protein BSP109_02214 [Brevibacterium sp. Mu109]